MTKLTKTIKAWSYIKLQRKIAKLMRLGYTYEINTVYKDWLGRRCVKLYKEVQNG
jgi:hypothetical protein